MVSNGWPSDKSIFEHAAYEILKWSSENKDQYRGLVGRSIEKRSELIFASRDNIPEIGQYRQMAEIERHKLDMEHEIKDMNGVQKIQLKSKRSYTLTQNKLDLSIFTFKDRPIFQKKGGVTMPNQGKVDILITKPKKVPLERVQDTSFTIQGMGGNYNDEDTQDKQQYQSRNQNLSKKQSSQLSQQQEPYLEHQKSISVTPSQRQQVVYQDDDRPIKGNQSAVQDDSFQRDDIDLLNKSKISGINIANDDINDSRILQ
eukprot:403369532